MSGEKYIGMDVHQATISVAVMDSGGKLVMESILETKAATPSDRCRRPAGPYPRLEPRHKRQPWFHGPEPIAS
jgi:hypothetical protein